MICVQGFINYSSVSLRPEASERRRFDQSYRVLNLQARPPVVSDDNKRQGAVRVPTMLGAGFEARCFHVGPSDRNLYDGKRSWYRFVLEDTEHVSGGVAL